jgi:8-oxo-dGTP pyrophosphatase MutT (NUDIX family)
VPSADRPDELRTAVYGERLIYDTQWVRMSLADIEPPDGRRFEHHVLWLPPVAIAAVVNDAEEVLMLWRHRWVVDSWGWELPGGIIEPGEDGAFTAAREVEEETGWRPGPLAHLVTFQPMMGIADARHEVYVGRGATRVGEPSDLEEAGRVAWIPMSMLVGLIGKAEVQGAGSLVGVLHLLAAHRGDTMPGEDAGCGPSAGLSASVQRCYE